MYQSCRKLNEVCMENKLKIRVCSALVSPRTLVLSYQYPIVSYIWCYLHPFDDRSRATSRSVRAKVCRL